MKIHRSANSNFTKSQGTLYYISLERTFENSQTLTDRGYGGGQFIYYSESTDFYGLGCAQSKIAVLKACWQHQ